LEEFVKGNVVVINYPYSDLSSQKKRPALVVATPKGQDLILCQITSQVHQDNYSIKLENSDFKTGLLNQISYIRPNKIISIDKNIVIYTIGNVKMEKLNEVIEKIIDIITN